MKRTVSMYYEDDVFTINEAFTEFMHVKKVKGLSTETLANYNRTMDIFCRDNDITRNTPITDITPTLVFEWVEKLQDKGIKQTSINHYLRDFRAFCYWCKAPSQRYLRSTFKIEIANPQDASLKLFNDEDIKVLLIKPSKGSRFVTWRSWAIINWVLATGNRASTICELKVSDIDFDNKEITLRHTKSKKLQIIPLSPTLEHIIKEYIKMFRRNDVEGWLFPNVGNGKLTRNALYQAFDDFAKSRGVEQHNIHGLRHNFAKGWVMNEGNAYKLQRVLGHSSIAMTQKYINLFSEDLKDNYEAFSPLDTMKAKARRTQVVKMSV